MILMPEFKYIGYENVGFQSTMRFKAQNAITR